MHRVELNIPSQPIFERVVRASAAEVGVAFGFSDERVEDLKLAISEAVNNAIDHGNRGEMGKLVAVVFEIDGDKLEIRISDQGQGMDEFHPSRHVIDEQNLERGQLRGFGMYLISELVDDYEVSSSHKGTVLTLRLYRREAQP
ncbi:putative anti-sigma regulatory factor, serine/threonine protein kinase [Oscillochloris trichoides DG-6]|uniref:Anti-sigma regulatory factor, serine/threonine protein kinase n=1 Tax=Oscillochloris trichoides DG-6 TaxID=765420 RepID=E1IGI5_9CHLR|nr:ATP-binding protein [Oscillochloris trichoides]EFO79751.1 putative anti-sigma regulatory factor, serine/threonine protein kinase [Oscillochloris trichoides DG-6]